MTTAKEELTRLLAQHQSNLNILLEQKAQYGAGAEPLSLLNQIEAERKAIFEIEKHLLGIGDEPSVAEQYFSKGTQAYIAGDLWEARRCYEIVLSKDPYYPRAQEQLRRIELELSTTTYVGDLAEREPPGCLQILRKYIPGGLLIGAIAGLIFGAFSGSILVTLTMGAFIGTGISILISRFTGW